MLFYYDLVFLLALVLTYIYTFMWRRHFDVHIAMLYILTCIVNLGYMLGAHSSTLEEALLANKITYLAGCYLMLFAMLAILSLCRFRIRKVISLFFVSFSTIIYLCQLTSGYSDIFYKSVSLGYRNGVPYLIKVYGFTHTLYQVMLIIYYFIMIWAIVYTYVRKKQVPQRILRLITLTVTTALICYFLGSKLIPGVDLMPLSYDLGILIYLFIVNRASMYEINESAVDSLVQKGETGFISFDYHFRYLGSNDTAKEFFPELKNIMLEDHLTDIIPIKYDLERWVEDYSEDESKDVILYEKNGMYYNIRIAHLYNGSMIPSGYQLFITDDTKNQKYISLLNSFNTELKAEVTEKTKSIVAIHDNFILGMATIVESRDNSTGGHIRRTSDVVRILVETMKDMKVFDLTDDFCEKVIKTAPLHDIGKIAVNDAILRKPGKFTPEEFEEMKKHSSEGARVLNEILIDDDEEFKQIAENIAHYHHERWDGSGYPEGLAGEDIPLEARIMAVADVYDALVSRRVYKKAFSFDEAHEIIMKGMGSQFDKRLEPCYLKARERLEMYYSII